MYHYPKRIYVANPNGLTTAPHLCLQHPPLLALIKRMGENPTYVRAHHRLAVRIAEAIAYSPEVVAQPRHALDLGLVGGYRADVVNIDRCVDACDLLVTAGVLLKAGDELYKAARGKRGRPPRPKTTGPATAAEKMVLALACQFVEHGNAAKAIEHLDALRKLLRERL